MRKIGLTRITENGFEGYILADELTTSETSELGLLPEGLENPNYEIPVVGSYERYVTGNVVEIECFDVSLINPFEEGKDLLCRDQSFDLDQVSDSIKNN